MVASDRLQLEITVEDGQAQARIKGVNQGLSDIGKTGTGAGRSAAGGMDQMTASMSKGVLAAGAITAAILAAAKAIKSLTVDAAIYAARTETLGVVVDQLARVNNLNIEAVRGQVEAIK
ncbi:MAG TPA: hypothetical protein VMX97_08675, partial [Hyphomicrobiaceae bacterium]|nr:hypothetical protein [Hyphomicrobiaceae bacterium]